MAFCLWVGYIETGGGKKKDREMKLTQPVPELPVSDVQSAQCYYRDRFGFKIEWLYPGGEIGAVSNGTCAIFFRRTEGPIHPGVFWIFAEDVDAAYQDLKDRGADIVDHLEDKPWGMRQFTIRDMNGNKFYVHHDLPTQA